MYKIGDYIKEKRISKGMTQAELAKGLTTQAQISKIESNETIPLSTLLISLAQRLEMSLDIFLNNSTIDSVERYKINFDVFTELLDSKNYTQLDLLLNTVNVEEVDGKSYRYICWLKEVADYQIRNKDIRKNINILLEDSIKNNDIEMNINLLNTLAIYNRENNLYEDSLLNFTEIMEYISYDLIDTNFVLKIQVNHQNLLRDLKKYQELYESSVDSINQSFVNDTMNYLPEFIYNKYYSLKCLSGNEIQYNEELTFAIYLAKRTKKFKMIHLLNNLIRSNTEKR